MKSAPGRKSNSILSFRGIGMVNLLFIFSTACGGLGSDCSWPQPDHQNCARKRMCKAKGDHPVAFFVAAVIC